MTMTNTLASSVLYQKPLTGILTKYHSLCTVPLYCVRDTWETQESPHSWLAESKSTTSIAERTKDVIFFFHFHPFLVFLYFTTDFHLGMASPQLLGLWALKSWKMKWELNLSPSLTQLDYLVCKKKCFGTRNLAIKSYWWQTGLIVISCSQSIKGFGLILITWEWKVWWW